MRNLVNALLAAVATLASISTIAFAQAPFPEVSVAHLKDNIYVASGGGGASTIIIGENGVIVVDGKNRAPDGQKLVEEVAMLTDKPITTVIITHSHPDHVRGLGGFPQGLTIIAHEGTKTEIEEELASGGPQAPPREYLPNRVVTQARESITIEGVEMTLLHIATAHTGSDLAVYLPDAGVVASGDLIGNGDPSVRLIQNGSSEGWIEFVSALVELDADAYVRGHADVATKDEVREILANAIAKRARIAGLVNEGRSLEEIKQAFGEPLESGRFPTFIESTYEELTMN